MEEKMFNKIYLQVKDYDGEENTEELITFAPIKVNDSDVEYMKTSHVFEFINDLLMLRIYDWDWVVGEKDHKVRHWLNGKEVEFEEVYDYWLTNIKEHE